MQRRLYPNQRRRGRNVKSIPEAMFEGYKVPLDFPMYEETLEKGLPKEEKKDPHWKAD